MKARYARWLVRLYPREWRARYGEEFEALLQESSGGIRAFVNVLASALGEHAVPAMRPGVVMNQYPNSLRTLGRRPSAFLPMAMSIAALAIVLGSIAASSGVVVRDADEGAAAHIWQLLMAGQVPILAYFVIRWLPRVPRLTAYVFALQVGAALAAMAPVYFLGL
jgi:hypothetical protein